MSGNTTKPTGESVNDFLAGIEDDARRGDCLRLVELMREATGSEPKLWGRGMVGFGQYHYRYESGREGDWFVTGFSPRKNDLTLYIMAGFERHEDLMGRLGRHRTGRSCLYIKRLADVDPEVLGELVRGSVRHMRETYEITG